MMYLIKQIDLYSPQHQGKQDIFVSGGKICQVAEHIDITGLTNLETIQANNLIAIPGLIDAHVHIAGAGGEGGPTTRTPEINLKKLIRAGVTTVIGCLGTDGITRNPESVLMKVKSLREEGISAWMYTGAYQVPTPTLTGNAASDLALIDEVIGVGEIAISDHRSSHPTTNELIKLAMETRVGAMLGGKPGIVNLHMGDAKDPFRPIHEAVGNSELQYKQFLPTHCNRNSYIYEDAKEYGKQGWIDLTTSSYPFFPEYEVKPSAALAGLLNAGVPLENITMTSDANGSLPHFDEKGKLVRLEMGDPATLLTELKDAVDTEDIPLEKVLQTLTLNPATILKLTGKGKIEQGFDADILFLDKNLIIHSVMAGGKFFLMENKVVRTGMFGE